MRYYYFNPFNKKCYFPEDFKKYPLFATFYQPYKLSAKLLWKVWRTSPLFRYPFSTNTPEDVLPLKQVGKYVSISSVLAFNLGSTGIEQKITVLGIDTLTNATFFIKYATTKVACKNVFNEGLVLSQLSHLSFVPKLELNVNLKDEYTLIKTSVLKGEKMKHQSINDQMLSILYCLSPQKVKSARKYNGELKSCFAHGDFCPWNMITETDKVDLYDWELAGQYSFGYDLFTYIFQYEFLVNETMRFGQILKDNHNVIQLYFKHVGIDSWMPYLKEFSSLKYSLESEKENKDLVDSYLHLKNYVASI